MFKFIRGLFSNRDRRGSGVPGHERRDFSDLKNPADWLLDAFLGELTASAGVRVTPLSAMGVSTVYAIVRVTSEALSTLPLELIRVADGKRERVTNHTLHDLLTYAPNDFMTPVDFLSTLEGHRTLRGNAYAQIIRSGDGVIRELVPMHNLDVRFQFTKGRPHYSVNGDEIPFADVLHLRGYSENGLIGVNPTSHLRNVIGLAIALQDNAGKFFANGSKVADVLSTDADLTPKQIAAMTDRMKRRKAEGEEYSTLVLDNGLKYVAYRSENRDSQMMEARRLQREELAAAFGIPASKIGILDHATFSNIEQLGIDFVVSYLQPIAIRWEQTLAQRLLTPRERAEGLRLKFDLSGLMRGDAAARSAYYHNGILDGWLTRNEVREREMLNPLDGLEEPLVPLNMLILDHIGRPVNPDPAAAPETKGFYPLTTDQRIRKNHTTNGHRKTFKAQ